MLRYWENYGVNARGIRYPGLLSWKTVPTGGTTDYAVEVFNEIQAKGEYTFYVREDTRLPMMMMDDAIRATLMLMEALESRIVPMESRVQCQGIDILRDRVGYHDYSKKTRG